MVKPPILRWLPHHRDPFWFGFALALLIGVEGGAIFAIFSLPLAWMLGAMTFTAIAAVAGAPIKMPHAFRILMTAVIGVLLGSAFTPDILGRLDEWVVTLTMLMVYILVSTLVVILFLRVIARLDPVTAFFSAVPGGFNEMVTVGREMGGDERVIALNHATRVFLVVMLIPIWYRVFEGYVPPPSGLVVDRVPPGLFDLALLAFCGVGGALVARAMRLPAALLLGPMAFSAAVHLMDITTSRPPALVVGIAQVIIGAGVGARFVGVTGEQLRKVVVVAVATTALSILVTVAFALLLTWVTGVPALEIVLAYAPGGLAEMSLVAIAIGADAALVSTHHLVRITAIVVLIPLLFSLFKPLLLRRSR